MLDAKRASALKKIFQNSQFKKKISLEERKAQKKDRLLRGNLMRCFHVTMSSDLLTRQVLGNHFLMETRINCLIKQDLNDFVRQEHQVGSLAIVSKNFSIKLVLNDWNCRTHNTEILKKTISPARTIIDEGKGWFSEILKSEVQEKIMRHDRNSLLGCNKSRTDEFSSLLAPELSRSK